VSFSHTCNSDVFVYLCGCCHRYIKTSGNATVDHLSKYLAVRLALEELRSKGESNQMNLDAASEKQYTIYIATANGQFTVSTAPVRGKLRVGAPVTQSRVKCTQLDVSRVGLGEQFVAPGGLFRSRSVPLRENVYGKSLVSRKGSI